MHEGVHDVGRANARVLADSDGVIAGAVIALNNATVAAWCAAATRTSPANRSACAVFYGVFNQGEVCGPDHRGLRRRNA